MCRNTKQGRLLFITGTDTGVGKTVITAGLLAVLSRKGYRTTAIKPFQTGIAPGQTPDAMFYKQTGLLQEPDNLVSPVCLAPPASPLVAAMLCKTELDLNKVYQAIETVLPQYDLVLVEGSGGLCVPITMDFWMADLIKQLGCPALLVARNSLGTLNHTLLSVSYAQAIGIPLLGVVINGSHEDDGPVESLNPKVIQELSGVQLIGTVPWSPAINVEHKQMGNLVELLEQSLDWNRLEANLFGKSGTLG